MRTHIRTGGFAIVQPSLDRQLAMDAFAALPEVHPMVALLELDVTAPLAAIERLQRQGTRLSLFAFLVRSIAVAIAEHPELNLVRHGKRLVRFDDVDVCVPVEVRSTDGDAPRQVVIRRAQQRSPCEIYEQLAAARARHASAGDLGDEDRRTRRNMALLRWLPRWLRIQLMRQLMRSAFRVKERAGTTLVTSVAKFTSIPGFAFTFTSGPRAAVFAIGSVVQKPWLHAAQITQRAVLSLSIMIDHDLVDGGPAARFARRLQELVESADGLEQRVAGSDPRAPATASA